MTILSLGHPEILRRNQKRTIQSNERRQRNKIASKKQNKTIKKAVERGKNPSSRNKTNRKKVMLCTKRNDVFKKFHTSDIFIT